MTLVFLCSLPLSLFLSLSLSLSLPPSLSLSLPQLIPQFFFILLGMGGASFYLMRLAKGPHVT